MKPVTSIDVVAIQATTHPTSVLRVRGNFNGATADRWLQFFDSNAAAAEGAVPIIAAIPLFQTSPFFAEFEIGALCFNVGCYACVSETQGTKTISSDKMDITIELDEPEYPTSTSFAGDLTTGVTDLQVWSEAAGATARKKLYSLEIDGGGLTGDHFIQIFAKDSFTTGDIPIISIPIAEDAALTGASKLTFGSDGVDIFQKDTTNRLGCTVAISSTAPAYTAPVGTVTIKAEYK